MNTFTCELCCNHSMSVENNEWWFLLEHFPYEERDNYSIVDKKCVDKVPSHWTKIAETENVILFCENKTDDDLLPF